MKRHLLVGAALLWSALAFAVPSRQDVEAAVKANDYPRAESMMREVVGAQHVDQQRQAGGARGADMGAKDLLL